jgi:hypothetical protein
MDALIKWISERLAERSSRRGFFSTMEKTLLGAAVIVTGQGYSAYSRNSAQKAQSLSCCDPTADMCPSNACPSGSSIQYAWLCHTFDGGNHSCNDCFDASGNYNCTYMSTLTSQA